MVRDGDVHGRAALTIPATLSDTGGVSGEFYPSWWTQ